MAPGRLVGWEHVPERCLPSSRRALPSERGGVAKVLTSIWSDKFTLIIAVVFFYGGMLDNFHLFSGPSQTSCLLFSEPEKNSSSSTAL